MAIELDDKGILEKYDIKVIGTSIEAIKEGENRERFREIMEEIDEPVIVSEIVTNMEEGLRFADKIGYPVVVRPAYTLGGSGGGIAEDPDELQVILAKGLHLSMVNQVLLEKSIKGWKEIEYEVMRDCKGNAITVCNMENIDPVGIHTGDSIVVAPSQTLSDKEYHMLRDASLKIIDRIGIEGGCNVQLALNPDSFEYAIIEINPRVSRSSALASKATGYPIAKVSAKLALGYGLDEILNAVTKKTYACFEPALDYVVIKIPKWPFDKFFDADRTLGTKMMATGEIMSIGNNFEAAFLKGIRSLEVKKYSLDHEPSHERTLEELKSRVFAPDDERIFDLAEMLRRGYLVEKLSELTGMDTFFINKIKWIVEQEEKLKHMAVHDLTREYLTLLKKKGFSDKGIADFMQVTSNHIFELRQMWGIFPTYKMVDTCAAEFEALSPYYYSSYDEYDEVEVDDKRKIMVIGSGPIRIGQGIEFDYCSVHCVMALKKLGIESIIVNNNPETVSTDFDISDKLYFEPLTDEDFYNIILKEKPEGVILQFGGQTAIKLAKFCEDNQIKVYGTSPENIDAAEDREKFDAMLEELDIRRPKGKGIWSVNQGLEEAELLGYPVLVRPSYVLGGQGMEICHDSEDLIRYLKDAFASDGDNPVLIDRYLYGREIEVDAICDGKEILIPGIMEHLEKAGVHSGDSISIYPTQNVSDRIKEAILDYTKKVCISLKVVGMINIQFIEFKDELYIIEVNPRSSRTVPYISKVTGVPIIDLATRAMLGEKLENMGYGTGIYREGNLVCVKVPVFSTEKLPNVEVSLGPEMRSTGEVLGVGADYNEALYKGLIAAGFDLSQRKRKILLSLKPKDKVLFEPVAKSFADLGYELYGTKGTAAYLAEHLGIEVNEVHKIGEGTPNIVEVIQSGEIDMVVNTPDKEERSKKDGFLIRRVATESSVHLVTNIDIAVEIARLLDLDMTQEKQEIFELIEYDL
jgi:carbamoyl-phosphate synthase large subunit